MTVQQTKPVSEDETLLSDLFVRWATSQGWKFPTTRNNHNAAVNAFVDTVYRVLHKPQSD